MKIYFIAAIVIQSGILFGQIGKIIPTDESKSDSSLVVFLDNLNDIVQKRDINRLRNILCDELYIPEDYQTKVNKEKFLEYYKKNNYRKLWNNFYEIKNIGGGKFKYSKDEGKDIVEFYMPYTSINLVNNIAGIDDLFDLGTYSVIISDSVKVYKNKSTTSKAIVKLNYDIVENNIEDDNSNSAWINIVLKDGRKGYVEKKYIRMLYDCRCSLLKTKDGWKIFYVDSFE